VQNLAAIGYDTNAMEMASYDWRLSYQNLEIRDAYFTRLKRTIETFKKTTGQKSVLASHSMGGTVVMYFLKWVEAMPEDDIDGMGFGGGGGPGWVEENVSDWVNIAGTLLGVSKSMTAFLSGEMKDTVEIVSQAGRLGSFAEFVDAMRIASCGILGLGKVLLAQRTGKPVPKVARE
jgi:phospholipid:diacylglycerol acyltransferase